MDVFMIEYWPRFPMLGVVVVAFAHSLQAFAPSLFSTTRTWGFFYLFLLGLWPGNVFCSGSHHGGSRENIMRAFLWTLALIIAAGAALSHGLKYEDSTSSGWGGTFLALAIYTRYFDIFWVRMYRPLFFLILAASIAVVGWGAEQIWWAGVRRT